MPLHSSATEPITVPEAAKPSAREVQRSELIRGRLDVFERWLQASSEARTVRKEQDPDVELPRPEECNTTPPELCSKVEFLAGPEATVFFRQPVPLAELDVSIGIPGSTNGSGPALYLACAPFLPGSVDVAFAIDLRFEQRWFYRQLGIDSLSTSVAMAPGETLSLSLRNTQRKLFDQETVNETERTQQLESTIVDKDILNVSRSSSATNNWNVSGNASFSIGGFGLGVGASVSESVSESATSSAQRARESTQKSASNLKTLQKVQVRESLEVTVESNTARKIVNPYRDRSLRLDVYSLAKRFCVEFHLVDLLPVLIIDLKTLEFDRAFVLTNGGFLSNALIDRQLESELGEALPVVITFREEDTYGRAVRASRQALDYLFGSAPIFNLLAPSDVINPQLDPNDAATSFEIPIFNIGQLTGPAWELSGIGDATTNNVGVVFTTLGYYHRLYRDEIVPNPIGAETDQLAVDLVTSLESALGPKWIGVEEGGAIAAVLDQSQYTEVLRRLGGFLTYAGGVIRPLVQTAEEDQIEEEAANRAETVITRVENHLMWKTITASTAMRLTTLSDSWTITPGLLRWQPLSALRRIF